MILKSVFFQNGKQRNDRFRNTIKTTALILTTQISAVVLFSALKTGMVRYYKGLGEKQ